MDPFHTMQFDPTALIVMITLFGIIPTIFWIVELIDVVQRRFPDQNTKILWLIGLLLSHGIGALIYFFVGRKQGTLA